MPFPTFDAQKDIPKGFESEYEEKDGKWVAKLPDVSKIEETLAKVRAEKKEAEKRAKESDEAKAELQRKLDAKEASGQDTDKKVSEMLAKWERDKNDAVAKVQAELDQRTTELRQIKLYDKAKSEFIAAGGRPEKADAALKLKKDMLDLAEDRPVVKNEKGEVTTESIADFWGKSFKKEMPEFFVGTRASGSGAGGGASNQPTKGDPNAAEMVIKNPLAMLQQANEKAAA